MIVGTFLEHYELADIDIYPFSQSASMNEDQFAQLMDFIKSCAKNADVHDGLFARVTDIDEISSYLEKNNLK